MSAAELRAGPRNKRIDAKFFRNQSAALFRVVGVIRGQTSVQAKCGPTTCPPFGRTRRGEGGKASTLDVAKAIADYAG